MNIEALKDKISSKDLMLFNKTMHLFDDYTPENDFPKTLIEKYFETLIYFTELADNEERRDPMNNSYRYLVEDLYHLNSEKVNETNTYIVHPNNPMMIINKFFIILWEKYLSDDNVLNSIVHIMKYNYERFLFYSRSCVYSGNEGYAIPYNRSNTTIDIQSILDKVGSKEAAVFGSCENNVKNNLHFFRNKPELGNYFFTDGETVVDLLDPDDLYSVFDKYHIVFFLDENCFYTQYQKEKSVNENSTANTCRWEFERAKKREDLKDMLIFCKRIYNSIGLWINSYRNNNSAVYNFDKKLYDSIKEVIGKNTAYIYTRSNIDYHYNKKEEYFNGVQLSVLKLNKDDEENFDKEFEEFIESERDGIIIPINELLNSIGYVNLSKKAKKFYLIINYNANLSKNSIEINYGIYNDKGKEIPSAIEDAINSIMKLFKSRSTDLYNAQRYIEKRLCNLIIENASSIKDLILALYINQTFARDYTISKIERCEYKDVNIPKKSNSYVKNIIYNFMSKVRDARFRADEPKMYLAHLLIYNELTTSNAYKILHAILINCKELNYIGYLYSNSKFLKG